MAPEGEFESPVSRVASMFVTTLVEKACVGISSGQARDTATRTMTASDLRNNWRRSSGSALWQRVYGGKLKPLKVINEMHNGGS